MFETCAAKGAGVAIHLDEESPMLPRAGGAYRSGTNRTHRRFYGKVPTTEVISVA